MQAALAGEHVGDDLPEASAPTDDTKMDESYISNNRKTSDAYMSI